MGEMDALSWIEYGDSLQYSVLPRPKNTIRWNKVCLLLPPAMIRLAGATEPIPLKVRV